MREKCCAILGSPPVTFPWGYDEEDPACAALRLLLLNRITLLRAQSVTDFYVVLDAGMGLYAAESIAQLRVNDKALRLICAVPWEGQATKWTPELRERYFNVQAACSEVLTVSPVRTANCEITAMLNAVDMADTVLAVSGEGDALLPVALRYAKRLDRRIVQLDPDMEKLRV